MFPAKRFAVLANYFATMAKSLIVLVIWCRERKESDSGCIFRTFSGSSASSQPNPGFFESIGTSFALVKTTEVFLASRAFQFSSRTSPMKLRSVLAAATACLFTIGASDVSRADVVFGNLGSSGTGALNGTNTDIVVTATTAGEYSGLAQGFTTGTSFLSLQSVTLGLFAESSVPNRTVSLYSNDGGVPGTQLAVSSAEAVGALNRYTFSFTGVNLAANTGYWIVPQADVSWHLSNSFAAPAQQNSSGYSYLGTTERTFESSGAWVTSPNALYSLSVNAVTPVPEPSTYALAAIGLGVAGLVRARRRKARG